VLTPKVIEKLGFVHALTHDRAHDRAQALQKAS
jgi:hypothetical protein